MHNPIRKRGRTVDDERIRKELQESLKDTQALRHRISEQWPQVLAITTIVQPRLIANGFTEALDAVIKPKPEEKGGLR